MKTLPHLVAAAALTLLGATGLGGLGASSAQAAPIVVDVSGAESVNLLGEDGNTVWWINVGANAVLNALDWSVQLEAFSPSVLSEMQVSFGASSGLEMFTFAPGADDFSSGVGAYGGTLDLSGLGFAAGADGLLRVEFSEGFKDFASGVAEGQWLSGNLTFDVTVAAVPEPASALLVMAGLGMLGAQVRRRRGTARS